MSGSKALITLIPTFDHREKAYIKACAHIGQSIAENPAFSRSVTRCLPEQNKTVAIPMCAALVFMAAVRDTC